MSRMIEIKSELIEEIDLAEEVINELNLRSLFFDKEQKRFIKEQYDDIADDTVDKAEKLYYQKRKARNIQRVEEALKKSRYSTKTVSEGNKTKIIAVQRVYA